MAYEYKKDTKFGIEVLKAVWVDTPIEFKDDEDCGCNKPKEDCDCEDIVEE